MTRTLMFVVICQPGGCVANSIQGERSNAELRRVARALRIAVALVIGCTMSIAVFSAAASAPAQAADDGARAISLYNIHNNENITIVYKRDGRFVPDAVEKLNWFLRDWRQDEPTKMDPRLFDLLWEIHNELGSTRPIHIISGYRSPKTNAMLRRTRGGQARRSQHMIGKAIDVHFPDVSVRKLRYAALIRQVGGVGYYPNSNKPFVHVDTGRVRHWPRMSRTELALLFPNGRTRHVPSDRKPLRGSDHVKAKKSNPDLAQVVARYHTLRNAPPSSWSTATRLAEAPQPARPKLVGRGTAAHDTARRSVQDQPPAVPQRMSRAQLRVASAVPRPRIPRAEPVPRLTGAPKLARDSQQRVAAKMLRHLASLQNDAAAAARIARPPVGGTVAGGASVIPPTAEDARRDAGPMSDAPDGPNWTTTSSYDEDHPEALAYSPFPISPYLTATSSIDDDALVVMRHPDLKKTIAMLSEADAEPMTAFVRGPAIVTQTGMKRFSGAAIHLTIGLKAAVRTQMQRSVAERGNHAPGGVGQTAQLAAQLTEPQSNEALARR